MRTLGVKGDEVGLWGAGRLMRSPAVVGLGLLVLLWGNHEARGNPDGVVRDSPAGIASAEEGSESEGAAAESTGVSLVLFAGWNLAVLPVTIAPTARVPLEASGLRFWVLDDASPPCLRQPPVTEALSAGQPLWVWSEVARTVAFEGDPAVGVEGPAEGRSGWQRVSVLAPEPHADLRFARSVTFDGRTQSYRGLQEGEGLEPGQVYWGYKRALRPEAPDAISVQRVGEHGARLVWHRPRLSEDGTWLVDEAPIGYQVYRDGTPLGGLVKTTSVLDEGLEPGQTHRYAVSAVRTDLPPEQGASVLSVPVDFAIQEASPPPVPGAFTAPRSLTSGPASHVMPKTALCRRGGVVYAHFAYVRRGTAREGDAVYYVHSGEAGKPGSFEEPIRLGVLPPGRRVVDLALAARGDSVSVAWIENASVFRADALSATLQVRTSRDGGWVFGAPVVVASSPTWKRGLDMAFDRHDRHQLVWGEGNKIFYLQGLEGTPSSVFDIRHREPANEVVRYQAYDARGGECRCPDCWCEESYTAGGSPESGATDAGGEGDRVRLEERYVYEPSLHVDDHAVRVVGRVRRTWDNKPVIHEAWRAMAASPVYDPVEDSVLRSGVRTRFVVGWQKVWKLAHEHGDAAEVDTLGFDYQYLYQGTWYEADSIQLATRPLLADGASASLAATDPRAPGEKGAIVEAGEGESGDPEPGWRISVVHRDFADAVADRPSHPKVLRTPAGQLWVVFEKGPSDDPNVPGHNTIFASWSDDDGESWSTARAISTGYVPGLAQVASGEIGVVHWVAKEAHATVRVARTGNEKGWVLSPPLNVHPPKPIDPRSHGSASDALLGVPSVSGHDDLFLVAWVRASRSGAMGDQVVYARASRETKVGHVELTLAPGPAPGRSGRVTATAQNRFYVPVAHEGSLTVRTGPGTQLVPLGSESQDATRTQGLGPVAERFAPVPESQDVVQAEDLAPGAERFVPVAEPQDVVQAKDLGLGAHVLKMSGGQTHFWLSAPKALDGQPEALGRPLGVALALTGHEDQVFEAHITMASGNARENMERAGAEKQRLFRWKTQAPIDETRPGPEAQAFLGPDQSWGYQVEYAPHSSAESAPGAPKVLDASVFQTPEYVDSKHLAGFERVWAYTQGIALAQLARKPTQDNIQKARALARYLCAHAERDPVGSELGGWPFSWNTEGDNWKDVRWVTGASAWAVHGLGRFIVSPAYQTLPEGAEKDSLKGCYRSALLGLRPHKRTLRARDGRAMVLMSAGWTAAGLKHATEPWKLRTRSGAPVTEDRSLRFAYYSVLDAVGYETYTTPPKIKVCREAPGMDCYRMPLSQAPWEELEIDESVWAALRQRVMADNIVTEHNVDVLAVLNHALDHADVLGLEDLSMLKGWRDALRDGVFYALWDAEGWKSEFQTALAAMATEDEKEPAWTAVQKTRRTLRQQWMGEALTESQLGRVVTGGEISQDADGVWHLEQSVHSAIDNCSWLSLSVDYEDLAEAESGDSMSEVYVDRLATCLEYTVLSYTRELGFGPSGCDPSLGRCPPLKTYRGAHYFQNAFKDPYIAPSELQESSYHLEATMGLILGLQAFVDAQPGHPKSVFFADEAQKMWSGAQDFVRDHGFPYSSQRIHNLSTLLSSSTAMIWFIDVYDALEQDGAHDETSGFSSEDPGTTPTGGDVPFYKPRFGLAFLGGASIVQILSRAGVQQSDDLLLFLAQHAPWVGGLVPGLLPPGPMPDGATLQDHCSAERSLALTQKIGGYWVLCVRPGFHVGANGSPSLPFDSVDAARVALRLWRSIYPPDEPAIIVEAGANRSVLELRDPGGVVDLLVVAAPGGEAPSLPPEVRALSFDPIEGIIPLETHYQFDADDLLYFYCTSDPFILDNVGLGTRDADLLEREDRLQNVAILGRNGRQIRRGLTPEQLKIFPFHGLEPDCRYILRSLRAHELAKLRPWVLAFVAYLQGLNAAEYADWRPRKHVGQLVLGFQKTLPKDKERLTIHPAVSREFLQDLDGGGGSFSGFIALLEEKVKKMDAQAQMGVRKLGPLRIPVTPINLKARFDAELGRVLVSFDTHVEHGLVAVAIYKKRKGRPGDYIEYIFRTEDGQVFYPAEMNEALFALASGKDPRSLPLQLLKEAAAKQLMVPSLKDELVLRDTPGVRSQWGKKTLLDFLKDTLDGDELFVTVEINPSKFDVFKNEPVTFEDHFGDMLGEFLNMVREDPVLAPNEEPKAPTERRKDPVIFSESVSLAVPKASDRFFVQTAEPPPWAPALLYQRGGADACYDIYRWTQEEPKASDFALPAEVAPFLVEPCSLELGFVDQGVLEQVSSDHLHRVRYAVVERAREDAARARTLVPGVVLTPQHALFNPHGPTADLLLGSPEDADPLRLAPALFSAWSEEEDTLSPSVWDGVLPRASASEGDPWGGALSAYGLFSLVFDGADRWVGSDEANARHAQAMSLELDRFLGEHFLDADERVLAEGDPSEQTFGRLVFARGKTTSKVSASAVKLVDALVRLPEEWMAAALAGSSALGYLGSLGMEADVGLETIFLGTEIPSSTWWASQGVVQAHATLAPPLFTYLKDEGDLRKTVPIYTGTYLEDPLAGPQRRFDDQQIYYIRGDGVGFDAPLTGQASIVAPEEGRLWEVYALNTSHPPDAVLQSFIQNHAWWKQAEASSQLLPESFRRPWLFLVELAIRGQFDRTAAENHALGFTASGGELPPNGDETDSKKLGSEPGPSSASTPKTGLGAEPSEVESTSDEEDWNYGPWIRGVVKRLGFRKPLELIRDTLAEHKILALRPEDTVATRKQRHNVYREILIAVASAEIHWKAFEEDLEPKLVEGIRGRVTALSFPEVALELETTIDRFLDEMDETLGSEEGDVPYEPVPDWGKVDAQRLEASLEALVLPVSRFPGPQDFGTNDDFAWNARPWLQSLFQSKLAFRQTLVDLARVLAMRPTLASLPEHVVGTKRQREKVYRDILVAVATAHVQLVSFEDDEDRALSPGLAKHVGALGFAAVIRELRTEVNTLVSSIDRYLEDAPETEGSDAPAVPDWARSDADALVASMDSAEKAFLAFPGPQDLALRRAYEKDLAGLHGRFSRLVHLSSREIFGLWLSDPSREKFFAQLRLIDKGVIPKGDWEDAFGAFYLKMTIKNAELAGTVKPPPSGVPRPRYRSRPVGWFLHTARGELEANLVVFPATKPGWSHVEFLYYERD